MSTVSNASPAMQRPHAAALRGLFVACGLTIGWVTADVAYGLLVDADKLRLLTALLLPAFGGAVLVALWRFGRQGTGRADRVLLVSGGSFLFLAASFDLVVTVRSDPQLTLEGNPYIRVLLDATELPLPAIYSHVVLTQTTFVAVFVTCWWAFLRHRAALLETIRAAEPRTWPAFVKAATGGGRLTYRQWLVPLTPSEIPNAYHSVWPTALAVSFGTSLFRYWAAAEWLSLVPATTPLRIAVLAGGVGGTLASYFGWLAWRWRGDFGRRSGGTAEGGRRASTRDVPDRKSGPGDVC